MSTLLAGIYSLWNVWFYYKQNWKKEASTPSSSYLNPFQGKRYSSWSRCEVRSLIMYHSVLSRPQGTCAWCVLRSQRKCSVIGSRVEMNCLSHSKTCARYPYLPLITLYLPSQIHSYNCPGVFQRSIMISKTSSYLCTTLFFTGWWLLLEDNLTL